jgi:hypothetical protein
VLEKWREKSELGLRMVFPAGKKVQHDRQLLQKTSDTQTLEKLSNNTNKTRACLENQGRANSNIFEAKATPRNSVVKSKQTKMKEGDFWKQKR